MVQSSRLPSIVSDSSGGLGRARWGPWPHAVQVSPQGAASYVTGAAVNLDGGLCPVV